MPIKSINPATEQQLAQYDVWSGQELDQVIAAVSDASLGLAKLSIAKRAELMISVAAVMRQRKEDLARLITAEMGKLLTEARGEIEKCAVTCEYYAENSSQFLADDIITSDASKSYVAYQPLGVILAIMPWNFPIWQAMRFAIPTLMAGNGALLKHASNVPQCAMAIESIFREAGFAENCFRTLMIESRQVPTVMADARVHAVSLTGSESAGREVAALAGQHLKKCVLELGGSDPFVVLDDADITLAVSNAILSRFMNCGQSCIAAKRFIVVEAVADRFVQAFQLAVEKLVAGDPLQETSSLAPMARADLRDQLHKQVTDTVAAGATLVCGGSVVDQSVVEKGFYYQPTIIDHIKPGMSAYHEELFGPVASIIRVKDENQAVSVANHSCYGLGGSVWGQDHLRAERLALKIQSGAVFVNGLVKSDARLPFGGIKNSGYGRELSLLGIREFVNAKTIWLR